MPIQEAKLIWKNGEMLPWSEATTHVLTHGLHYGTGVFEGIDETGALILSTPRGRKAIPAADIYFGGA